MIFVGLLFAALISAFGWVAAMLAMAATALATIPLAGKLVPRHVPHGARAAAAAGTPGTSLREQLHVAMRDKSYWCLHAGFFTCGFHIAFLVTHLPGEVQLCGMSAAVKVILTRSSLFTSIRAGE